MKFESRIDQESTNPQVTLKSSTLQSSSIVLSLGVLIERRRVTLNIGDYGIMEAPEGGREKSELGIDG
jgi:hypothetical protein